MDKKKLRQKLVDSGLFSNDSSIRALLNGTRYPSYSKAIILEKKYQIPVHAWKDIKSFVTESITSEKKIK